MADLSNRLANLSPEKRALLLQKLKSQKNGDLKPRANINKGTFVPGKDENFSCEIIQPGNFTNLDFRRANLTAPNPWQIQIKAKAASLNFRDLMIAMNMYPKTPGVPSVMGSDYSGIVSAVGNNVKNFKIGDEVIALSAGNFLENGSIEENSHFCGYFNGSEKQAVHKPKNINFEEAAGIPTVFLTSYYSLLNVAKLQLNEKVLIHTATGGIGLSALQIAKWIGAEIFATAGSIEKRDYLKSLGIKNPMDSRSTDFARKVMELTNNEGVDVVLNTLSGEAGNMGLEILSDFGCFLQIDKKDIAQNNKLELRYFNKGISYTAIDLSLFLKQPDRLNKIFNEIINHIREEHFKPIKYKAYSIWDLGEALTYMSRSQHIGKIVLKYD